MNILIVDDDRYVIEALRKSINWNELGFSNVLTAMNMNEAIQIIETEQIDLLLSDIDMPGGSGIDLLKWIHDTNKEITTIFLTNYADFNYAQLALQLGSADYILKPIEYDKLIIAIKNIMQKTFSHKVNQNIVLEKLWMTFLSIGGEPCQNQLLAYYRISDETISANRFLPVLFRFSFNRLNEDHSQLISFYESAKIEEDYLCGLFNMFFSEINSDHFHFFHMPHQGSDYIAIFNVENIADKSIITMGCEDFLAKVRDESAFRALGCAGQWNPIAKIRDNFNAIQETVRNNPGADRQLLLTTDNSKPGHDHPALISSPENLDTKALEILLDREDFTGFKTCCLNYLKNRFDEHTLSGTGITDFQTDMSQVLHNYLLKQNILSHKLFHGDDYNTLSSLARNSLYDMTIYVHFLTAVVENYIHFAASQENVAKSIREYVDMHYAENINRNLLSNIFYLDPDYASRLFKKETGRTFGSYVIECRINSAKKLLKDTDLPVSAISGNVGYPDYSYFIRIFKKITGVTPNDYRNSKDWDAL